MQQWVHAALRYTIQSSFLIDEVGNVHMSQVDGAGSQFRPVQEGTKLNRNTQPQTDLFLVARRTEVRSATSKPATNSYRKLDVW